jgi:tetratricopeptide (TPR) repeat protein
MGTRVLVFFTILLVSSASADTALSDNFLNAGFKAYLNGNIEEAIEMFQKSSAENPANTKAKNALLSALLFEGKKRFNEKNYLSSKSFLDRALAIDPANAVAKDFLSRMPADRALRDRAETQTPQKSKNETDLETRAAAAADAKSSAPDSTSSQTRADQVQKIIVETRNLGASSEGLDEFITALRSVEKQSREAGDLKYKLGASEEQIKSEKERGKSKNYIFIAVLVALIAVFVAFLSYFLVRFYRFRVKLAEHSYQFTAEREAKILQVMNNVVNLEYKSTQGGAARLIEAGGEARPLLEQAPEPAANEVILVPENIVKRLEDLGVREQVSKHQVELDLSSSNAHVRAVAILCCLLQDKQRGLDLVVHAADMEFENARLMGDLIKVTGALGDVDCFALLAERRAKVAARPEVGNLLRELAREFKESGKLAQEPDLDRLAGELLASA